MLTIAVACLFLAFPPVVNAQDVEPVTLYERIEPLATSQILLKRDTVLGPTLYMPIVESLDREKLRDRSDFQYVERAEYFELSEIYQIKADPRPLTKKLGSFWLLLDLPDSSAERLVKRLEQRILNQSAVNLREVFEDFQHDPRWLDLLKEEGNHWIVFNFPGESYVMLISVTRPVVPTTREADYSIWTWNAKYRRASLVRNLNNLVSKTDLPTLFSVTGIRDYITRSVSISDLDLRPATPPPRIYDVGIPEFNNGIPGATVKLELKWTPSEIKILERTSVGTSSIWASANQVWEAEAPDGNVANADLNNAYYAQILSSASATNEGLSKLVNNPVAVSMIFVPAKLPDITDATQRRLPSELTLSPPPQIFNPKVFREDLKAMLAKLDRFNETALIDAILQTMQKTPTHGTLFISTGKTSFYRILPTRATGKISNGFVIQAKVRDVLFPE